VRAYEVAGPEGEHEAELVLDEDATASGPRGALIALTSRWAEEESK
jgi:hypothetical protein